MVIMLYASEFKVTWVLSCLNKRPVQWDQISNMPLMSRKYNFSNIIELQNKIVIGQ